MLYLEHLKKIRKSKKITQRQLAGMLGKSKIVVHCWETGKRNPCESDIRMIAQILEIRVSEISDLKEFKKTECSNTALTRLSSFLSFFKFLIVSNYRMKL
jgi:transcriptional regulator with XRE-family HTH domain